MNKQIENLIIKSTLRDVEIKILEKEEQGLIISKEVAIEILREIENELKNE